MRVFLLAALLGGCSQAVTTVSEHPIRVSCKGDVQTTIVGSIGPTPGLNASITGRCSGDGAYFEIGPPP